MSQRAADGKTTEGQGLVYFPRSDATPQTEAEALATIYGFLLESHAAKKNVVDKTTENPQGDVK